MAMRLFTECGKRVERATGLDLDDVFAYTTPRMVVIKDRRLGLALMATQVAVFVYIVVYQVRGGGLCRLLRTWRLFPTPTASPPSSPPQIAFLQAYMREGAIIGQVRLRVQNPEAQYRWAPGTAPYCVGEGTPTTNFGVQPYRVTASGTYEYTGGNGVATPQLPCMYLPSELLSPDPTENGAIFIPSWINTRNDTLNGSVAVGAGGDCSGLQSATCTYTTASQSAAFVRDIGVATLLIDHSFSSTTRIARNSVVMNGDLLDPAGRNVDVCDAYTRIGQRCPSYVAVGVAATNDIVPLQALLTAGGVTNLDWAAGSLSNLRNKTRRMDGVVVLLQVRCAVRRRHESLQFPQFCVALLTTSPIVDPVHQLFPRRLWRATWHQHLQHRCRALRVHGEGALPVASLASLVRRLAEHCIGRRSLSRTQVSVVPETGYRAEDSISADGSIISEVRTVYDRRGIRIVVSQGGRIGGFNFQVRASRRGRARACSPTVVACSPHWRRQCW